MHTPIEPRPVVIIGGGISGLTAAYRLTRASIPVHLVESSDQLGGLGMGGEIGGVEIERFYHCVMPTDEHLLPLLNELGLADTIRWQQTTMGMNVDGRRFPFNSAMDLLRFTPLRFAHRIRFGAVSLLLRRLGRGQDLDNTRTEDWLRSVYGPTVWQRMLKPLFGAKFGDAFGEVPARYLYQRLGRESNVAIRGYPEGTYRAIVDRMRTAIETGGGRILRGVSVQHVALDGDGARVRLGTGAEIAAQSVISTVPIPLLHKLADERLRSALPRVQLDYQGVVNAVFLLDRPLDGHYWAPVINCDTEFDGVVEMSALTGTERFGGRSLVYVMHYCGRDSALFAEPEADIAHRWKAQLRSLYPDRLTDAGAVEYVKVFKAPFVEPIPTLGYHERIPAVRVGDTNVFLATTAQIYPDVTSWNSSVGLADRVVREVIDNRDSARRRVVAHA
ncbi:FAD-dependent oxidoreductase [Mycolicibacterium litorale]|uniref:Oxidoreductase n=1 Tax=Mycolicibacterium litorale TaxID=758802 RepID=A0AAD1MUQ6_9MYCO|nr:FAD-dependent oxidoreductase [Mycolicibacterium litorale]MCV7416052.1 FAD-dependent oxidoreductase [Mycolicibacterium litorale]TDY09305.1 protoporphyrinogen oxidase [Mycolicibacterium litorale]BBY17248.1 oxidoreductase [Mycolicibacterium litorale]